MNGSKPNSFMILTNLQAKDSNNVFVALHFNKLHKRLKVNRIASIYGKNNLSNYIENNFKENNILQVNSAKLKELFTNRGLQLPKLVQTALINNIPQNNQSVNQGNIKNIDRSDLNEDSSTENTNKAQEEYDKRTQAERVRIAQQLKERSFYRNVLNSDIPTQFRQELEKDTKDFQYMPMSNKETLSQVMERLRDKDIEKERQKFIAKETVNSSQDTAMGEVLISKYLENGDYSNARKVMVSLAEKLTKARTSNTGGKHAKKNDS